MRVIRTAGSLDEGWIPRLCTHPRGQPYAILSHRWLEDANDEVLYADIEEVDRRLNSACVDREVQAVAPNVGYGTSIKSMLIKAARNIASKLPKLMREISTRSTDYSIIRNQQYTGDRPDVKEGFGKLKGAAQKASSLGYDYIWIDSCCIDKSSSAELSEAINSMWAWYRDAGVCLAYLSDVSIHRKQEELGESQWWTRGWTLQELLAPRELMFFSQE